ncbi:vanadium-dependent haloperoxidase [Cyclobacterium jeungdonense]|uniref:Vanadium-dependent haloperoxidase n=1 Tax=Cyclobacterium jeungdonense TaxID=708087 RepID=A0ABT8C2D4_9BACT|nr:vanadium-dependent haloperoxidase [Cyclobacterium jeungdonense]MDN3686934.1 vanadium-dependent haloperoxidase [Cyclobacterium jeungdonense]
MNLATKHLRINLIMAIFGWSILFSACSPNEDYKALLEENHLLIDANGQLTDIIVHDIFSPPVASRIYAYPAIAAYEAAVLAEPETFNSLMGQLKGSNPLLIQMEGDPEIINYHLVALAAYYKVATQLVFSEQDMMEYRDAAFENIQEAGMPESDFEAAVDLGESIGEQILAYAAQDNYHQSRSFEKYTIRNDPGSWRPTPPAYMEGIEPHWNKIRTFFLDSANQFIPPPPPPFDTVPDSRFYQDAYEVMEAGNQMDDVQEEIAYFWDCNPYKMNVKGHVMYAEKKITPGGHWMGIAGIASKAKNLDWKQTAETMAVTSIYVFDAFISCWDEKYRSVLIRPETYINRYMDESWTPLLQTPPFPEYTSGHSVISTAASLALTDLLGEPFTFLDSTEVKYGLGTREFNSFREAAEEAAISRFYGGIHYLPAIEHGVDQGKAVASWIDGHIQTRKISLAENALEEN